MSFLNKEIDFLIIKKKKKTVELPKYRNPLTMLLYSSLKYLQAFLGGPEAT
jgi:hypothetical protein